LIQWARDAEQAGWDGFFIWDHVARNLPLASVVDPWIVLSGIAMVTSRIKIGALVTPLPRRRPWKVARETVSLDHLSNGRLIFGAGTGGASGVAKEWANFGEVEDLKTRGAMLDEGLEILDGLWSGEVFDYAGQYYKVKDSQFLPRPVQQPRIPIWIAGFWPNKPPFRRAARWDGVFPLFAQETNGDDKAAQLKEVVDYVRQIRPDLSSYDVVCQGRTDPEAADQNARWMESYKSVGATWWFENMMPTNFGGSWEQDWHEDAMHQRILAGPPRIQE
jgi:alkanesulfonate monooxygenase SsuD/methylene tetrahydromethanopterin reductase-like flavin-dependent oxidoreductase (luciferase family)